MLKVINHQAQKLEDLTDLHWTAESHSDFLLEIVRKNLNISSFRSHITSVQFA
jgi:hypothetical protein